MIELDQASSSMTSWLDSCDKLLPAIVGDIKMCLSLLSSTAVIFDLKCDK